MNILYCFAYQSAEVIKIGQHNNVTRKKIATAYFTIENRQYRDLEGNILVDEEYYEMPADPVNNNKIMAIANALRNAYPVVPGSLVMELEEGVAYVSMGVYGTAPSAMDLSDCLRHYTVHKMQPDDIAFVTEYNSTRPDLPQPKQPANNKGFWHNPT